LKDDVDRVAFDDTNLSGITSIAAGVAHSLALSNGDVNATGFNNRGQLGLGGGGNKNEFSAATGDLAAKTVLAIAAGDYYSFALTDEGKIYAAGYNDSGQLGLGDLLNKDTFMKVTTGDLASKNVTAIAAGGAHSLALDDEGKIYATGFNGYGQLGSGGGSVSEFEAVTVMP
jgi:alpha-tubulin suppressor-like RCC1 family protein